MSVSVQRTVDELRAATQILVGEGILDGFGHVSARLPDRPDRYFMLPSNLDGVSADGGALELDADSNPIRSGDARPSIERFIHGEIYRQRPDVLAIVHTHAPALIPFGVSDVSLRPLYHMCGFLEDGVPVFDIRNEHGVTNMLVTSPEIGQSLAASLGGRAMVLMRGHGATIVGTSLKEAVFRSVYATLNAQLQPVAMQLGQPTFLDPGEAKLADALHHAVIERPWAYWMKKHGVEPGPHG
ncbi:class II aldolase/adducin family protein [Pendulispora brunnea]|uniref:Class II aldolase/adducin family protein n=1 Tax=Pendulispora brunnea TaxID=2905690 RepID=A0ABZ2KF56_9BACT